MYINWPKALTLHPLYCWALNNDDNNVTTFPLAPASMAAVLAVAAAFPASSLSAPPLPLSTAAAWGAAAPVPVLFVPLWDRRKKWKIWASQKMRQSHRLLKQTSRDAPNRIFAADTDNPFLVIMIGRYRSFKLYISDMYALYWLSKTFFSPAKSNATDVALVILFTVMLYIVLIENQIYNHNKYSFYNKHWIGL